MSKPIHDKEYIESSLMRCFKYDGLADQDLFSVEAGVKNVFSIVLREHDAEISRVVGLCDAQIEGYTSVGDIRAAQIVQWVKEAITR